MDKNIVKQKLYEKYIEPTKKKRNSFIGVEIEIPILNLNKKEVDFDIIHKITDLFIDEFGFDVVGQDDDGNAYCMIENQTGDIVSYDCSYNNLEFSFGKEKCIQNIENRFNTYYRFFQKKFVKYNYTLSGFGINPYRIYNNNVPIPNERYRMLFHHLHAYSENDFPMHFHDYPAYGTFSSASQVQLDVSYDELIQVIRVFSLLEPIKSLIFANSVLLDEQEDLLCARDMLWENSPHGINPHNIGMFEKIPETIEELQAYIESTSIYCVERDGKYLNFEPINILEYFEKESIIGEYFDGEKYCTLEIHPRIEDLDFLRTFKFEDLTYRGTIEFRSVCCQPIKDAMSVAAFHIGCKENLQKLDELLKNDNIIYHHGYHATELRKLFNYDTLPIFVDEDKVYELANTVLELSCEGLKRRGYGEEKYLEPLFLRVKERSNPAKYLLSKIKDGIPIQNIVAEYATLREKEVKE